MWGFATAAIVALVITGHSVRGHTQTLYGGAEPGRLDARFQKCHAPQMQPRVVQGLESIMVPAEAAGVTFTISSIRVAGSTVYEPSELELLCYKLIGIRTSLAEVFAVAANITAEYGQDGYLLSCAIVPSQELNSAGANIVNEVVECYVDEFRWPEATNPHASDLAATAAPEPIELYATVDNHGVTASGPYQASAGIGLNNLLGWHERIERIVAIAGPSEDDDLEVVVVYVGWNYEQVLNAEGMTFDLIGNISNGEPGTAPLPSVDFETEGFNFRSGFSYPFIRSRSENLTGFIDFEFKNSQSENLGLLATEDRLRIVHAEFECVRADEHSGVMEFILAARQGIDGLSSTSNANPRASWIPGRVDFIRQRANSSASRAAQIPMK